jgi:hypothetical protein
MCELPERREERSERWGASPQGEVLVPAAVSPGFAFLRL